MSLITNSLWFCHEEEETALHVLCQCEGLVRLWFRFFGEEKLTPASLIQESLSGLQSLIKQVGLERVLQLVGATMDMGSRWRKLVSQPTESIYLKSHLSEVEVLAKHQMRIHAIDATLLV